MTYDFRLTELAPNISVYRFENYLKNFENEKEQIIELVDQRFITRYFNPLETFDCSGSFAAMALCCLLIEMFMSFRHYEFIDTNGHSKEIFIKFFCEYENEFDAIDGKDFYSDVRCGILHMGETRRGWKLTNGKKFLIRERVISVPLFRKQIRDIFEDYLNLLRYSDFESEVWKTLLGKFYAIIENCKA
jgi:hypothetical protein